jgi:hypothetical protein
MGTLRVGSQGTVVRSLQNWLTNFEAIKADGFFGEKTRRLTRKAQRRFGLEADGVVGPLTFARFMQEGWLPPEFDQPGASLSPYPAKPTDYSPLSQSEKIRKWGRPGVAPTNPTSGGQIVRDRTFSANIVRLDLKDWFPGVTGVTRLDLHKKTELQWRGLFDDLVAAGLGSRIVSCGGSWNPRFIRGSTSTFSAHAFATAVDFNAPQNWMGAQPAKKGKKGSLVEVVPHAQDYSIWWGGWFSRVDGMHFESTATDAQLGLAVD